MITTLPHMCALLWSPPPDYGAIVVLSTAFLLLWHAADGPAISWLGILDHEIAALWFLADCYYLAASADAFQQMLVLSGAVFGTNLFVSWLDRANLIPYYIGHSAWHLVSALKAFYVAALISRLPAAAAPE
jgi:hypothetical protein